MQKFTAEPEAVQLTAAPAENEAAEENRPEAENETNAESDLDDGSFISIERIEYSEDEAEPAAAVKLRIPEINAASAIVIDMNSGRVLY